MAKKILIGILVIIILGLCAFGVYEYINYKEYKKAQEEYAYYMEHYYPIQLRNERIEAELDEVKNTQYEGVFLSLYPAGEYKAEDYELYLGIKTFISNETFENLEEIMRYLNIALVPDNKVECVYLGLDPSKIFDETNADATLWLEELRACIEKNEKVQFEVVLPYPSLDHWLSLDKEEIDKKIDAHYELLKSLDGYENVQCYYIGAEKWLVANRANYLNDFEVNEEASFRIMAYTVGKFRDKYEVTKLTIRYQLLLFNKFVNQEKENNTTYSDLSQWQMVFFGDSVMGNYPGSISIPGMVHGLSDAEVFNYDVGGTMATQSEVPEKDFLGVLERFVDGTAETTNGNWEAYAENPEKQQCFVIHFGLNDYFENQEIENPEDMYDVHTFKGAMRTGIRMIKENYPDAVIMVIAPNPVYQKVSHNNAQSNYATALKEVADEMSVLFLNNYAELEWKEEEHTEYLDDLIHPNEEGRMIIAMRIIDTLKKVKVKKPEAE